VRVSLRGRWAVEISSLSLAAGRKPRRLRGDQSCLPHSRRHHDVPGALRRYERQAIPKANILSWLAGTEATNRYEPRRTKLMPNPLATAAYNRWLRLINDNLR
jgi:hypothetical protein